jgi:arginine decarboxylase
MGVVRVVWGTAGGPTATSSYDAALAAAGVHDYNLVTVSSVLPADATVEHVGTAPDLGPAGEQLTVVQSRATVQEGAACAGRAWAREHAGPGRVSEAAGSDPDDARERVETGLAAGKELRDWEFADGGERYVTVDADAVAGNHATAVVLAVYGESRPLL